MPLHQRNKHIKKKKRKEKKEKKEYPHLYEGSKFKPGYCTVT